MTEIELLQIIADNTAQLSTDIQSVNTQLTLLNSNFSTIYIIIQVTGCLTIAYILRRWMKGV